jgi:hypothetical protein
MKASARPGLPSEPDALPLSAYAPSIRATVARFPYLDKNRNARVEVATLPCQIRAGRR